VGACIGAVVAAVIGAVVLAAPAFAQEVQEQTRSSCSGSIKGEPASAHQTTDTALPVDAEENVEVSGQAPGTTGQMYVVELELLGRRWSVAKGDVTQESWIGTVKVGDYSGYSVGLFKVIGSVRDRSSGNVVCSDFMYVEVGGRNPLTTVAGAAGAVAIVGGGALIASAAGRARRAGLAPAPASGAEWGASAVSGRGVGGGALAGAGAAVELQQFAVAYLSMGLLLGCVAAGVAVGIVVPLAMAGRSRGPGPVTTAPAWGTHVAPPGGLTTWSLPDPTSPPSQPIDAGVPVQVVERQGDWARVECSNGWTAWVDGRLLP
jgi:hypothetical protein